MFNTRFKKLEESVDYLKKKFKDFKEDNSNDDQIDLLENLTKFLLDKEGLRLYKLKNDTGDGCWNFWGAPFTLNSLASFYLAKSTWEDEPMYEEIKIDELKTLGDYTTISIGKQKYFIAKRRAVKKEKKEKK